MRAVRSLLALLALSGLCLAQPPLPPPGDNGGPGAHNWEGGPPNISGRTSNDLPSGVRPRSINPPGEHPPPPGMLWGAMAAVVAAIGLLTAVIGWLLSSRAIREARIAAARSLAQSRRFSADAAHELKTPLAVLQGIVEHAVSHADGNRAVEELGTDVLEELRRLKSILRRLLLLSQSDAGKLPVRKQRVDLSELMSLMMEDFALLAPGATTETDFAPGVVVTVDRELFTQALRNLFSNAAKYNEGDAVIRCALKSEDGRAVLTVSNGVDPLNPPQIDRLFERFYRGDPAHGREVEGSGLGLSLARELVQAMGGTLTAAMEGNDRVVFTAALPCC